MLNMNCMELNEKRENFYESDVRSPSKNEMPAVIYKRRKQIEAYTYSIEDKQRNHSYTLSTAEILSFLKNVQLKRFFVIELNFNS